jgi:hypothetical protein
MLSVGALAFLNPWLLAALAALPVLWVLLRAIPPGPRRVGFAGVGLLLGLEDRERTPVRTPWWLLLLRCLVAAAAILAFAQPILNPRASLSGGGPLLLVVDGGWASAPDWPDRRARALDVLDAASRDGRPVAFVNAAAPPPDATSLEIRPAAEWRGVVETLRPSPWPPARDAVAALLPEVETAFTDAVWMTDGLAQDEAGTLGRALADIGPLTVFEPATPAMALRPPLLLDGDLAARAVRVATDEPGAVRVVANGLSERGDTRRLGQATATFAPGETVAEAVFDLPLELRNRVTHLSLDPTDSAGAIALADDGVRRRRVGLVSGGAGGADQRLVSDLHFIRTALEGRAEIVEGSLLDVMDRAPDVVVLADVGRFTSAEVETVTGWLDGGGLLVRFAGPRLSRGSDAVSGRSAPGEAEADPFLPVRLRGGGRTVGGAMAWTRPQQLRPFPADSPFEGLPITDEIEVSRQILAEIDPMLPSKTWAALEDGTPLVTAERRGDGRVVLFHVTANAEWSSLPLSGLFVGMVDRLLAVASGAGGRSDAPQRAGETARPITLIDGFGRLADATSAAGVPVERLDDGPGPEAPPGIYAAGETTIAHNLLRGDATLSPLPPLPVGTVRERLGVVDETPLAPWLLATAVVLLSLDTIATLWLSGRLTFRRRATSAAIAAVVALAALAPTGALAQSNAPQMLDDETALRATTETVLAYVLTGDPTVDRLTAAGMRGLGDALNARTAVEPTAPVGVDLETDVIAFYPFLYWPITPSQPTPSDAAIARLNAFMRTGGMIVFDTRDQHLRIGTGSTPNGEALRRIAGRLDLPPLEPVPQTHVLTRTFFLLDTFPGRYAGGRVWVEAGAGETASPDEAANPNDGVSPVIVGNADWAAAWAIDEDGRHLAPIAGADGWRQREMAYRFGVNAVMYAMTGNYKSDQVHVPALLERLGQ